MSCLIKPFHCIHCSCILNYHPLSGQKYYLYWKFAHYFVSCFKCFLTLWLSVSLSVSVMVDCHGWLGVLLKITSQSWLMTQYGVLLHLSALFMMTHIQTARHKIVTLEAVFLWLLFCIHVCVYGPTYYLTTLKTCCIHTSLFLIPFLLTGPIMPRHFGSPTRS